MSGRSEEVVLHPPTRTRLMACFCVPLRHCRRQQHPEVAETDRFILNTAFRPKHYRVKINQIQQQETVRGARGRHGDSFCLLGKQHNGSRSRRAGFSAARCSPPLSSTPTPSRSSACPSALPRSPLRHSTARTKGREKPISHMTLAWCAFLVRRTDPLFCSLPPHTTLLSSPHIKDALPLECVLVGGVGGWGVRPLVCISPKRMPRRTSRWSKTASTTSARRARFRHPE